MDRYNLSIIDRITLDTTLAGALSYNDGLYYIGTGGNGFPNSENALLVYNSSTMDLLMKITGDSSYFGPIRQCSFARNNTLMLVLSQASLSYSLILLYQINSPTNYTLINNDIKTSAFAAYNIFRVNDTFFYFILYIESTPIYTLTLTSDGQTWSTETFITQGPQPTLISSVTVDSYGRVWATDPYTYIYIYEATTGALLGTFNRIPNPYYILLLDNYELFVSTTTNTIYRLAPNIQCTC
jgi:outer membrane protein assembly factor BamB